MAPDPSEVTILLNQITGGRSEAAGDLLPLVYDELRRLARARMAAEAPGQTMQATALVHEAYLRLVHGDDPGWDGRGHFFAAAAEAMRRILIDRARSRAALRHGGGRQRMELNDACAAAENNAEGLIELDAALGRLEVQDTRMSQVVKLRYFAGLTVDQISEALGVPKRSVERDWTAAKAWLRDALREPSG